MTSGLQAAQSAVLKKVMSIWLKVRFWSERKLRHAGFAEAIKENLYKAKSY
jgi:hypothetical protein